MTVDSAPEQKESLNQSHLRTLFRFEPHYRLGGNEATERRDQFARGFLSFFKKGENNILLREDASISTQSQRFRKLYQEGLRRFEGRSRHGMANIYAALGAEGENVTDPQVELVYRTSQTFPEYETLLSDALDIAESYGLVINVMFEPGINKGNYALPKDGDELDPEQVLPTLTRFLLDRDSKVIEQIKEIEVTSRQAGSKTNLLVLLGSMHSEIVTRLPLSLQRTLVQASADSKIPSQGVDNEQEKQVLGQMEKIFTKLTYGEPVSKKEWEQLKNSGVKF